MNSARDLGLDIVSTGAKLYSVFRMVELYSMRGKYVISDDLARVLGIARITIMDAVKRRKINAVKIGKGRRCIWLIRLDDRLAVWLGADYDLFRARDGERRWRRALVALEKLMGKK